MNKINGFNLFECMVVLVIISILSSLALPFYRNYMVHQKSIAFIHEFIPLIENAKVSAMLEHEIVTICASRRGEKCGGKWEEGILVFTDLDGSSEFKSGDKKLAKMGPIEK